jgi:hypothetical protein
VPRKGAPFSVARQEWRRDQFVLQRLTTNRAGRLRSRREDKHLNPLAAHMTVVFVYRHLGIHRSMASNRPTPQALSDSLFLRLLLRPRPPRPPRDAGLGRTGALARSSTGEAKLLSIHETIASAALGIQCRARKLTPSLANGAACRTVDSSFSPTLAGMPTGLATVTGSRSRPMASAGHTSTQAPHLVHREASTCAFPSTRYKADSGHTSKQVPHPMHSVRSILSMLQTALSFKGCIHVPQPAGP